MTAQMRTEKDPLGSREVPADALYGVSMQGNGVTTVVSQRVRDVAPAV